jgi:hypothetical protein
MKAATIIVATKARILSSIISTWDLLQSFAAM